MKKKYDLQWLGLSLGIILPLITFVAFYFYAYSYLSFGEFYKTMQEADIHVKLLSLCVIPNLLMFFAFIWTYRNYSARGVLMATFIYAIVIFAVKLLF